MAEINSCPKFWTEHPNVLFQEAWDFFPFSKEAIICSTTALNSVTRFGLYLGIALFLLTRKTIYLGIPVLSAILAIALYYGMKNQGALRQGSMPGAPFYDKPSFREGFDGGNANNNLIEGSMAADKLIIDIIGSKERTSPSKPNPFMNVLINEISENPNKPPAKYSMKSEIKSQLDSQFTNSVYSDPGDIWNRSQSQREFYTMPSTSIPNDRESYQNWLYRTPGKTCKEGNMDACTTVGTDGSQLVFLSSN
jgi:hypothetical protein